MINNSRGQLRADPHLNNNELLRSPLMSTVIYHNHHIIPKYRCKEIGIHPDFEGNVIRLTRLEHAEAHYHRWLKHKDPRDLGAAQLLALGEIDGIDFSGKNHPRYGKKHSQETIKKNREWHLGKKQSPETIEKRVSKLRGKKLSPEHLKKLSEVKKGKKLTPEHRKSLSESQKGKIHSAETRKKMSASSMGDKNPNYGKVITEETRKKISEAKKGKKYIIKQKENEVFS
jgi:hypothetical protein